MKHARTAEAGPVELLIEILRGTGNLAGAACAGEPALFDPGEIDESAEQTERRHRRAVRICQGCPVFYRCAEWSAEQPVSMVTAGRIPPRVGRPHGSGAA